MMIRIAASLLFLGIAAVKPLPRDLDFYFQKPTSSAVISGRAFGSALIAWSDFSRVCGCGGSALSRYKIVVHRLGGDNVVDFFMLSPNQYRTLRPEAQYRVSPDGRKILDRRLME